MSNSTSTSVKKTEPSHTKHPCLLTANLGVVSQHQKVSILKPGFHQGTHNSDDASCFALYATVPQLAALYISAVLLGSKNPTISCVVCITKQILCSSTSTQLGSVHSLICRIHGASQPLMWYGTGFLDGANTSASCSQPTTIQSSHTR